MYMALCACSLRPSEAQRLCGHFVTVLTITLPTLGPHMVRDELQQCSLRNQRPAGTRHLRLTAVQTEAHGA